MTDLSTVQITVEDKSIPCSLYQPQNTKGLVLMGHGLGVDRHDITVAVPARVLADEFGFAVLVPELPLHGDRLPGSRVAIDPVSDWRDFWASESRNDFLREWHAVLAFATEFGVPVFYFGLSLGTQYGVVFLSQVDKVKAAVLGLFGSDAPPKSILMNRYAPRVELPVYFIQKLDDELHSAESSQRLYESLGSEIKVLDSTPGRHQSVAQASIDRACGFLAEQLSAE